MSAGEIIWTYLAGVAIVWTLTSQAMRDEPTTHGQDVLFGMGCLLGFMWPLALTYFVLGSPFFAWMLWKTRGER